MSDIYTDILKVRIELRGALFASEHWDIVKSEKNQRAAREALEALDRLAWMAESGMLATMAVAPRPEPLP